MQSERHGYEDHGVPVMNAAAPDETVPAAEPVSDTVDASGSTTSREIASDLSMEPQEPKVYDPTRVIRGYEIESEEPANETGNEAAPTGQEGDPPPESLLVKSPTELVAETEETGVEEPVEGTAKATPPPEQVADPLQAKVREMWSLMFSSRYEDDDDLHDQRVEIDASKTTRPQNATTTSSKNQSSLRAKLDRERRLDEQIQTSTRSKRRSRPEQAADPIPAFNTARRRPKPVGWQADDRPFERAGLLATSVRFCMEKAMQQAFTRLAELHAIAQNEPTPTSGDVSLGVFLTQWELDQLLDTLFHPVPSPILQLSNPEYAALSLDALLRVSWCLPLDDFTSLRSCVAEISRKRLSDANLALLNAALHRHFVLRPFPGVKMQRLLLRIVEAAGLPLNHEYHHEEEKGGRERPRLVSELFQALHIRLPTQEEQEVPMGLFLQLRPAELCNRFQLSSMLSLQRLLFFRFLINDIATQKTNQATGENAWWPRSTGKLRTSTSSVEQRRKSEMVSEILTPQRSISKRKKTKKKLTEIPAPGDGDQTEAGSELPVGWSTIATHGSAASPVHEVAPPEYTEISKVSDTDAFTKLQDALSSALATLVRANPWLVDDERKTPLCPSEAATRASFLAAETFQQSLSLLTAAPSTLAKMEEFTMILNSLTTQVTNPLDSAPPEYDPPEKPADPLVKPPPLHVQRANSGSFPPLYVPSSPAYWTFEPEIPVAVAVTPTSILKAKASPGVGAYDIRRSEKLTFQQRAGHSFAKARLPTVDEPVETKATSTPVKRELTKTRAVEESTMLQEPPAYTQWTSAASTENETEEIDSIDAQVQDALRLQSRFVLDDLVQNLLHRGKPVTTSKGSRASSQLGQNRLSSAKVNTSEEKRRPTTSRVVSRVRTIATARTTSEERRKDAPRKVGPQPPPYEEKAVKQPPRDYEPPADDAHLQWAARVSAFYKAQLQSASGN